MPQSIAAAHTMGKPAVLWFQNIKAVLICASHQGDFVACTQNWTLTVPMPEVCYADQVGFRGTSYEGLGPDCVISKHHGPKSKPKHTFYRFSWNAFPLHTHRATVLHVEQ